MRIASSGTEYGVQVQVHNKSHAAHYYLSRVMRSNIPGEGGAAKNSPNSAEEEEAGRWTNHRQSAIHAVDIGGFTGKF